MKSSRLTSVFGNAEVRELLPKLWHVLKLNGLHAELARAFEVQAAVVNEDAFGGLALRDAQGKDVDFGKWLSNAEIARAEKGFEVIA
jgi:hypothetical protein